MEYQELTVLKETLGTSETIEYTVESRIMFVHGESTCLTLSVEETLGSILSEERRTTESESIL